MDWNATGDLLALVVARTDKVVRSSLMAAKGLFMSPVYTLGKPFRRGSLGRHHSRVQKASCPLPLPPSSRFLHPVCVSQSLALQLYATSNYEWCLKQFLPLPTPADLDADTADAAAGDSDATDLRWDPEDPGILRLTSGPKLPAPVRLAFRLCDLFTVLRRGAPPCACACMLAGRHIPLRVAPAPALLGGPQRPRHDHRWVSVHATSPSLPPSAPPHAQEEDDIIAAPCHR